MSPVVVGERAGALQVVVGTHDPGEEWDTFMARMPSGHLMQSRAWARVKQEGGWEPIFLRLTDGTGIRAAALLLRRGLPGTKLGMLYMPRGPVLGEGTPEVAEAFATALRQVACDRGAFMIQADPAIPADRLDMHETLLRMGFQREEKHGLFRISQPIHVMRIPLDRYGGPHGLRAAFPHKTRYNIGLAERKGVVVVPRTDGEAARVFHRLLWEAGRGKGFPVRSFGYHEAIWRHCVQTGLGEYLFAEYEGRVLGAIQVLRFGPTAWYMYGASAGEHQDLMASYLLQWTGISRSWEAGCRCYDMRGVYTAKPQPQDEEYGVYDFKRKFQAELVNFLGEYDLVLRPMTYAVWRRLEAVVQGPARFALHVRKMLGGVR